MPRKTVKITKPRKSFSFSGVDNNNDDNKNNNRYHWEVIPSSPYVPYIVSKHNSHETNGENNGAKKYNGGNCRKNNGTKHKELQILVAPPSLEQEEEEKRSSNVAMIAKTHSSDERNVAEFIRDLLTENTDGAGGGGGSGWLFHGLSHLFQKQGKMKQPTGKKRLVVRVDYGAGLADLVCIKNFESKSTLWNKKEEMINDVQILGNVMAVLTGPTENDEMTTERFHASDSIYDHARLYYSTSLLSSPTSSSQYSSQWMCPWEIEFEYYPLHRKQKDYDRILQLVVSNQRVLQVLVLPEHHVENDTEDKKTAVNNKISMKSNDTAPVNKQNASKVKEEKNKGKNNTDSAFVDPDVESKFFLKMFTKSELSILQRAFLVDHDGEDSLEGLMVDFTLDERRQLVRAFLRAQTPNSTQKETVSPQGKVGLSTDISSLKLPSQSWLPRLNFTSKEVWDLAYAYMSDHNLLEGEEDKDLSWISRELPQWLPRMLQFSPQEVMQLMHAYYDHDQTESRNSSKKPPASSAKPKSPKVNSSSVKSTPKPRIKTEKKDSPQRNKQGSSAQTNVTKPSLTIDMLRRKMIHDDDDDNSVCTKSSSKLWKIIVPTTEEWTLNFEELLELRRVFEDDHAPTQQRRRSASKPSTTEKGSVTPSKNRSNHSKAASARRTSPRNEQKKRTEPKKSAKKQLLVETTLPESPIDSKTGVGTSPSMKSKPAVRTSPRRKVVATTTTTPIHNSSKRTQNPNDMTLSNKKNINGNKKRKLNSPISSSTKTDDLFKSWAMSKFQSSEIEELKLAFSENGTTMKPPRSNGTINASNQKKKRSKTSLSPSPSNKKKTIKSPRANSPRASKLPVASLEKTRSTTPAKSSKPKLASPKKESKPAKSSKPKLASSNKKKTIKSHANSPRASKLPVASLEKTLSTTPATTTPAMSSKPKLASPKKSAGKTKRAQPSSSERKASPKRRKKGT